MVTTHQLLILSLLVSLCSIFADAFFLNWGSTEVQPTQTYKTQWPHHVSSPNYYEYYQQRYYPQAQASSIQAQYVNAPPEQPILQHGLQRAGAQISASQQQQSAQIQGSQIPAIPIQMPLHAQLSPMPNIQNVQLVPCLCPITQEEIDRAAEIYSVKPNKQ